MKFKTLDGYELKEGDTCWAIFQCLSGDHELSSKPREATYLDETAKENHWQFTAKHPIKSDCESIFVESVWKNNPNKESVIK
jgi:hypothetical protein